VSDPLPHDRLMRELRKLWRQERRAKLAAAGIEIRRPHRQPPDPPERPATADEWARALVDVAAVHAGGVENVRLPKLLALADDFRSRAQVADEVLPLLELSRHELEEALTAAQRALDEGV
jgi:hypothetical protein